MTRIKRGFVAKKRRKKILQFAKGFVGSHSKLFTAANQQTMKSLRYSYFDRRKNKNHFKKLWIKRINAASRSILNTKYNVLIKTLKESSVMLNRKMLAKICTIDKNSIKELIIK